MKRPCFHPGCPALVDYPARRCDAHQHQDKARHGLYDQRRRAITPELALAAQIRSSGRWKACRARKLARDPLCEAHPDGRTATATQVHHVEGLAKRPDLAFTPSNLMSVCTACHARLEREERAS